MSGHSVRAVAYAGIWSVTNITWGYLMFSLHLPCTRYNINSNDDDIVAGAF
jgi:hypothetical protein